MKKRVVVTGLGIVSPCGIGRKSFLQALQNGQSGIKRISAFDAAGFPTRIAGEVENFKPATLAPDDQAQARFAQFALAAAEEAVQDAGLIFDPHKAQGYGAVIGTSRGGALELVTGYEKWRSHSGKSWSGDILSRYSSAAAAHTLAERWHFSGPVKTVAAACASGTVAIGAALRSLQRGEAEVMLTGGSEASISKLFFAGACTTKAMSVQNDQPEQACRPFDARRDGYVMSEGAGIVVLETLSHAHNRGAEIYAELCGYGLSCDAYHVTAPAPSGEGLAAAMQKALLEAGADPAQVDYINAHGTGTRLNDACETLAIKKALGDYAYKVPVSSTKSMTGHMMGAAGAVEFIASVLALKYSFIPPTINYEEPDPACDLYYVPNYAIKRRLKTVLTNSAAFGGHNASLILRIL